MNYTKKILLIYITKVVGLLTGLASVFLVIPALSSNPAIFGVFTICINLNIFFTYADLGFISAGQKYAAEFFAQGDKNKEIEVIGFVTFLLSIFITLISIVILMIAYNPHWLVSYGNEAELAISTKLLIILAFFAPTILLQRFNAIVYSIRLEDYIYQLIEIVANICKICSIGFFVTEYNYEIVAYFFTIQALSTAAASIAMIIAVRRYNFSFRDIFKHFRFSKDIYLKTKSLAVSSLLLTISWILYFEIDSVLISKLYGLTAVAIYAIAFTFLSFSRNLYNTLYSPFQIRFNHLVGLGEDKNLLNLLDFVIKITFPLCIIPPLVLILYMRMIIISWVGLDYLSSLLISRLFILVTALLAITIPLSYVIIAKSQNRILRMSALILPLIFYITLIIFDKIIGVNSLAFAKVITVILGCSITFYGLYGIAGRRIIFTYLRCFIKILFPLIILSIFYFLFPPVENVITKSTNAFFQLFIHIVPAILFPLIAYYLLDKQIVSFIRDKINVKIKLISI